MSEPIATAARAWYRDASMTDICTLFGDVPSIEPLLQALAEDADAQTRCEQCAQPIAGQAHHVLPGTGGLVEHDTCCKSEACSGSSPRAQDDRLPSHLRGDGPCQDCGTADNIVWYTESPLWNHVMGGPGTLDDPGGIVCPRCFIARVDAAGLVPTGWRLLPEWPWREKTTVQRAQEPLVIALPPRKTPEDGEGVGKHTPTPQPLSNAQLQAIHERATAAHAWLKFVQRRLVGDDWLPLSVRHHFDRDMPRLLAAARHATQDAERAETPLLGGDQAAMDPTPTMTASQQEATP